MAPDKWPAVIVWRNVDENVSTPAVEGTFGPIINSPTIAEISTNFRYRFISVYHTIIELLFREHNVLTGQLLTLFKKSYEKNQTPSGMWEVWP